MLANRLTFWHMDSLALRQVAVSMRQWWPPSCNRVLKVAQFSWLPGTLCMPQFTFFFLLLLRFELALTNNVIEYKYCLAAAAAVVVVGASGEQGIGRGVVGVCVCVCVFGACGNFSCTAKLTISRSWQTCWQLAHFGASSSVHTSPMSMKFIHCAD